MGCGGLVCKLVLLVLLLLLLVQRHYVTLSSN